MLGMYYAAWVREFGNLTPSEVVLVSFESQDKPGKTFWYLASIEEAMEDGAAGNYPDV